MAKRGRPKIELDFQLIEDLAMIQCTQAEIAAICGCSVDTLARSDEFKRIYEKGQQNGKMSLRRWQYAKAKEGNTTMLIWLGKQYLGQRDTPADESDDMLGKVTAAIQKAVGRE